VVSVKLPVMQLAGAEPPVEPPRAAPEPLEPEPPRAAAVGANVIAFRPQR
jgi:hypothetical protein